MCRKTPTSVQAEERHFQEKPPRPKYTEIWDASIVLIYLQSLSPVDTLSLKELTLKLVVLILLVSGKRG